jgi:hypothetical protein
MNARRPNHFFFAPTATFGSTCFVGLTGGFTVGVAAVGSFAGGFAADPGFKKSLLEAETGAVLTREVLGAIWLELPET